MLRRGGGSSKLGDAGAREDDRERHRLGAVVRESDADAARKSTLAKQGPR